MSKVVTVIEGGKVKYTRQVDDVIAEGLKTPGYKVELDFNEISYGPKLSDYEVGLMLNLIMREQEALNKYMEEHLEADPMPSQEEDDFMRLEWLKDKLNKIPNKKENDEQAS